MLPEVEAMNFVPYMDAGDEGSQWRNRLPTKVAKGKGGRGSEMLRRIILVLMVGVVMVVVLAVPAFAVPGLPGNLRFGLPDKVFNLGGDRNDKVADRESLVCDIKNNRLVNCRIVGKDDGDDDDGQEGPVGLID